MEVSGRRSSFPKSSKRGARRNQKHNEDRKDRSSRPELGRLNEVPSRSLRAPEKIISTMKKTCRNCGYSPARFEIRKTLT